MLMGLGSNVIFYKDLLEKIGVKAEIIKVGKYKSAVEPFTRTEVSEANREQRRCGFLLPSRKAENSSVYL